MRSNLDTQIKKQTWPCLLFYEMYSVSFAPQALYTILGASLNLLFHISNRKLARFAYATDYATESNFTPFIPSF